MIAEILDGWAIIVAAAALAAALVAALAILALCSC